MPTTIARAPLRSEVRRLLLEGLLRGAPPPGTSLNEAALAAELGVSRTPLREALLALEREGFLTSEPGRGFFARPLTRVEVEELYPMLWTLEGLALRNVGVPSRERVAALERLNRELAAARHDPEAALVLDRRWHRALLESCSNRRLLETLDTLQNQAYRYEYAYMRDSGHVITSVGQHAQILRRLRAGDVEAAVRLLETNWRVSVDYLVPWLASGAAAAARHPGPAPRSSAKASHRARRSRAAERRATPRRRIPS